MLRCPYCGEADHQHFGSLTAEDSESTCIVDTCLTCRGYVKTRAVLQPRPPYAVILEDLATVERKRNPTPDAIGMAIKRDLLESVTQENPAPEAFERWLMERCQSAGVASGPVRAMALDVYAEWRLAEASRSFQAWLERGAPSDDAQGDG